MKRFIVSIIAVACALCSISAQEVVDSSLVGQSIINLLPSRSKGSAADINLYQSQQVKQNLDRFVEKNKDRVISGYRVRIFFDNKQNARSASEAAVETFKKHYRGVETYRSYQSPFFKVTVGDFRTKSDAMVLLRSVKNLFPSAFIVKEAINYPSTDREIIYEPDEPEFTETTDSTRVETTVLL